MQEKLEIAKLQKEKRRYESKGNFKEVATVCNKLGELLSRLGEYDDAIVEHEQELALSDTLGDQLGAAVAHRRIGECCSEMGQYDRALCHQQRHLELARCCGSKIEQQRAFATIGRTHYQQAEACSAGSPEEKTALDQAEQSFKQSLAVCEDLKTTVSEIEYSEMKARLLLNFGLIYDCRGNINKCAEFFKRAIQTAERHKLYEDLYRCQYNLSGIYQRSGNLSQALRHVDLAIKCSLTMKDKLAERESLSLKGKIFLQLGDISAAKRTLKKAYKMVLGVQDDNQGHLADLLKSAVKMGRMLEELRLIPISSQSSNDAMRQSMKLYENLGDTATKMECYQVALNNYLHLEKIAVQARVSSAEMIPIFISIAQTCSDLKKYKQAIIYFKKELECRKDDLEQECKTWMNIGNIHDMDGADYETIRQSYEEALQRARKLQNVRLQVGVLDSLRTVQWKHADIDGHEVTNKELERLCSKYGIDPNEELLTGEGSQTEADDDCSSSLELDLDDISDGSDVSSETDEKDAKKRGSVMRVKKNEKGESPLHRACIEGNLHKVKLLIESGHPVNPRDYCGWLPLHEAANHGFVDIVQYLLDKGARIDDRGGEHCNGISPLHDACSCGNDAVIKVLVDRGANVIAKDNSGKTPLDSLLEYYSLSKDELSNDEIKQFKFIENLLKNRMRAVNPVVYNSIGSKSSSSPASHSSVELKRLGRLRRKHLSQRLNTARMSDVEPDSDDDQTTNDDTYRSALSLRTAKSAKSSVPEDDSFDSGDESVFNPYIPRRQIEDIQMLHDPMTASMAYHETMNNLRSAATRHDVEKEVKSAVTPQVMPALVNEAELIGDDWLINDTRSTKRKRAENEINTGSVRITSKQKRLRQVTLSDSLVKKTRVKSRLPSQTWDCEGSDDRSNEELPQTVEVRTITPSFANSNRIITLSDYEDEDECRINEFVSQCPSNTPGSGRKQKTQLKLTNFGNPASVRSSSNAMSSACSSAKQVSNSKRSSSDLTLASSTSQQNPLKMRLKVHIADNLLVVPILLSDVNQTVLWLAEQAADRYHQIYNIRPIGLTLALQDGAKLAPNDRISSTFLDNEELFGSVDKWELPSMSTRYCEHCCQLKCTMYANVKLLLHSAERSCCLQLKNLMLRPQHFLPIVRAVQLQTSLRELDLQGNRLGNEGLSSLIPVLSTLPNLSVLDLSCNGVTDTGLNNLATALEDSPESNKMLQLLERLVLSFNTLNDNCCLSLARCIKRLPRLRHLLLASCGLTVKFFEYNRAALAESFQGATNLQLLDLSVNKLGATGIDLLLRSVDLSRLVSINFSNTINQMHHSQTMKHICHHLSHDTCALEELYLECCHLNSENVPDLCRLLQYCKTLKHLSLSGNVGLTASNLGDILAVGRSIENNCAVLFNFECVSCGLVSPLDVSFLDALNDRLQRQHDGQSQLARIRLSVAKLCKLDAGSLREIWTGYWHERAVVDVTGDLVLLSISNDVEWSKL